MTDMLYLGISFTGLLALAIVLHAIGKAASECPKMGGAAKVG